MLVAAQSLSRAAPRVTRLSLFRNISTSQSKQRLFSPIQSSTPSLFLSRPHVAPISTPSRPYSATSSPAATASTPDLSHLDEAELKIHSILSEKLKPTELEVRDVSGGCGSMYAINVTSEVFRGLSVIKQHRMVNEALKAEMAGWHGCQVRTRVP
ncbi:hypothetical protein KVT40_002305 [Elsinoe batatas]|uniref:Bola-like protein n=1 Tax=Elsinoe batatas TaxID=2601811 RepID=A0A8K0L677_9PEZI|nr:hypothetical protein KVT40_002305 [Elsinoe batatas]